MAVFPGAAVALEFRHAIVARRQAYRWVPISYLSIPRIPLLVS